MEAARNGYRETAVFLVTHGADPNAKDREGKSAASMARDNRYDDIAEIIEGRRKPGR
jgi:ankyrin repeat protein